VERVQRGERIGQFEASVRCKDEGLVDAACCLSPVWDAAGTVAGLSAVTWDITERKRAEAERRALEHRLHQSERLESLGQLASGVAHDYNNLLAAIMSYAGFVVEETAGVPAVRADAEQIQAAANRAAALTKQLVFSRRGDTDPGA
jgi:two-component system cell cycle sensor histidine kinase/response regulator CckA